MKGTKLLATAVALLLLAAAPISAQKSDRPVAGIDLHGKVYMGIIPVSEQGPDPDGESRLPFYFAFGQEGNKLYGCVVQADKESLAAPSAQAVDLTLTQWTLKNGVVNGNQFTCDLYDEQGKNREAKLKGVIQGAGEQINLFMTYSIFEIGPFYIYRCNVTDKYSGIYVGYGDYVSAPSATNIPNNILIGFLARQDGTAAFAGLFYNPHNPAQRENGWGETDDFNPETGAFHYEESGAVVDGYIGGGVMDLQMTAPGGHKAEGTLYLFETQHKKPKLQKPKPAKLPKGKMTTVKIKHVNVLRGTFISDNNPGVVISSYRYSPTYLYVDLDVAANASGKLRLTLTAPDGSKYAVKKLLTIK
jgi:hypothetical protein